MAKTAGRPQPGTPNVGPTRQELQAAYQAHTLAQMLYGQLASVHPWINPAPPMGMVDPMTGPSVVPWARGWPVTYGGPIGHVGPMGFYWTGPSSYFGSEFLPR